MYRHWENQKRQILDIISNGQSATCQVCYGTNYSIFFRNIHSDLLLKKSILPVYVDINFLNEYSIRGFSSLLLSSMKRALVEKKLSSKMGLEFGDQEAINKKIAEIVDEAFTRSLSIVVFFEDIESVNKLVSEIYLFSENLKKTFPKCSFIYLTKSNILHPVNYSVYKKAPHIYENVIYLPVRDEKSLRSIERGMTAQIFSVIYSLTGGVDKFHGIALDLKNNLPTKKIKHLGRYISENWNLKRELHRLWDSLSATEVKILALVVWGIKDFEDELLIDLNHLVNLGLIKKERNVYKLAIGLLKSIGLERSFSSQAVVEVCRGQIVVNGNRITKKFTEPEKRVLKELLINKNKIVGRRVVAKSLRIPGRRIGGEGGVDKTINKIKTKLSDIWVNPENLVSLKERGFIYKES